MWHGVITELDDIDWESIFPNNFTVKNEILETYKELAPWYSELVKPKTKEISSLFTTPFFNHSNTNLLDKDLYIMSEPLRTHSIFRELKEKKLINLYENCVAIELQDCDGNNKKTNIINILSSFLFGLRTFLIIIGFLGLFIMLNQTSKIFS